MITEGQAMAGVTVKVGTLNSVAAITEGSVKNMGLKLGDSVTVAVKATEVMIGKYKNRATSSHILTLAALLPT
jgi:molybdopterin-binding protein